MLNKVQIIGHLGNDPDVRDTNIGPVATISVAATEKWKDKQGNRKEHTEWFKCSAFGALADVIHKYLQKGSKVYIEGKLRTEKYEKDGVTHYATKVIIEEMKMLDTKSEGERQPREQTQRREPSRRQAAPPPQDDFDDEDLPF